MSDLEKRNAIEAVKAATALEKILQETEEITYINSENEHRLSRLIVKLKGPEVETVSDDMNKMSQPVGTLDIASTINKKSREHANNISSILDELESLI